MKTEILSPSKAVKNKKNIKFDIYEAFGVKYYLIVDPLEDGWQLFKLEDTGTYALIEGNYIKLELNEDCIIQKDLSEIFDQ